LVADVPGFEPGFSA